MKIPMLILAIPVALSCLTANAQENDANSRANSDVYRVVQERSAEVPDGVVFQLAISSLTSIADADPDFAVTWVQQEIGLNESAAQNLIYLLRSALTSIHADTRVAMHEKGCTSGVPRVYGENTYAALEEMEDAGEEIAENQLLLVKNQIGEKAAIRFQVWLDKQKLGTVHRKYDQKKLSTSVGASGYERLEKICRELVAGPTVGGQS